MCVPDQNTAAAAKANLSGQIRFVKRIIPWILLAMFNINQNHMN